MTLEEVVQALSLKVLAGGANMKRQVTGGYSSDLLSCVIGRAEAGCIWVTIQGHPNVVAVASLKDLTAVVVAEGAPVDPETVKRAEENDIPVLATAHDTFTTVSRLAALGIQGTG